MKFIRKVACSRLGLIVCGTLVAMSLVYGAFALQSMMADSTVGSRAYMQTPPQTPDAQYIPEIPTEQVMEQGSDPEWGQEEDAEMQTFTAREEIALPLVPPTQEQTQAPTSQQKPTEGTQQTQKPSTSVTTKPPQSTQAQTQAQTQKPQGTTGTQTQKPISAWNVTYAQAKSMVKADSAYDYEDLYWLSRIIYAEARGESFTGQIGVGTVVLNRVRSGQFPNTVKGVVFDQKYGTQFTPVANGTIYQTPSQSAIVAAKMCLDGYTLSDSVLYFLNPRIATSSWIQNNRKYAFRVGNHDFYY